MHNVRYDTAEHNLTNMVRHGIAKAFRYGVESVAISILAGGQAAVEPPSSSSQDSSSICVARFLPIVAAIR